MKLITLAVLTAGIAAAQTPSGLLTGPVTYTSTLTSGNPYGDNTVWTKADGSTCSASGTPSCYIVKYVVGVPYNQLVGSDGTGNCYVWQVSQLTNMVCQSSFVGGAPGEYGALYCANTVSSDINGTYSLSCTAGWDGTAITVINGVDTPIPTLYALTVTITHHPVSVWIPAHFRTPRHLETWQQIDSMSVTVTPPSGS